MTTDTAAGMALTVRDATPITELIRTRLRELPPSQARVGRKVLENPLAVAQLSAEKLARLAEVSQASVTRFCQALGLPSYQSLLLRIAQESGHTGSRFTDPGWDTTDIDLDVSPDDDIETILHMLVAADIRGLQLAAQSMDLAAIDRAVRYLLSARRIDIYGCGASGVIAQELEMILFRVGLHVRAWTEGHLAHTSAALLTSRDVAIAISDSGNTRETYEALTQAKERCARTIAITRDPRSAIGRLADIPLTAFGGKPGVRPKSFASRHAQLLLIDLLYVRLAQQDYERSSASIALTSHIAAAHAVGRRKKDR
ncbi:MurR/RpiR family transcriptional regulator [Micromonospora sp. LZ34]